MRDCRDEWRSAERKVAVTVVDVTGAAQALVRERRCGPTAAHYLAEGLAAAALLGAGTGETDETVSVQVTCSGPLGGLVAECSHDGTLRGDTREKVLDEFDGMGRPKDKAVLGDCRVRVTRTAQGRILSQSDAPSLDGCLAGTLRRKATIRLEASVSDDVNVLEARGVLMEALEDGADTGVPDVRFRSLAVSERNLLRQLGLAKAELTKSTPIRAESDDPKYPLEKAGGFSV